MVRKWSYINNCSLEYQIVDWRYNLTSSARTKVFRRSIKFKKFNIGFSKVVDVRKKNAKRKRVTLGLRLSFILIRWSTFYMKLRQFWRFYQSYGIFNINMLSADIDVLQNKISKRINLYNVNLSSCSKSIISYYLNYYKSQTSDNSFFKTKLKHIATTTLSSNTYASIEDNRVLGLTVTKYNNLYYPLEYLDDEISTDAMVSIIKNNYNNKVNFILNFIVIIFKIIIKLTLRFIKVRKIK